MYEGDDRSLGHTRSFNFLLKAKLDPEFYRKLKVVLYDIQTAREVNDVYARTAPSAAKRTDGGDLF